MRFANPKSNIAFKKIFANEKHKNILMSLLNAVLKFEGDSRIVQVEILDPYQAPRIGELKETTLDVKAVDASGRRFIVEMQVGYDTLFYKRAFYYLSKAYTEQLKPGGKYKDLCPVFFIGFLDFNLFNEGEDKRFYRTYMATDQEKTEQSLDLFSMTFIELKKFTKTLSELHGTAEKWYYFFCHAQELEDIPDELKDPEIVAAFTIVDQHTWTQTEMDTYEYWIFEQQKIENLEEEILKEKAASKNAMEKAARAEAGKARAEAGKARAEAEKANVVMKLDKAVEAMAKKFNISIDEAKEMMDAI